MRQLSKVVWYEGMPLAQHHFQEQARYFESSIGFTLSSVCFAPYGFERLELDDTALAGGIVRLTRASGLMPDGLAFQMPDGDALPEARPIADAFSLTRDTQLVLLAVPPYREHGANVDGTPDTAPGSARFTQDTMRVLDEAFGRDVRDVAVGRKNFRLLLDGETLDQDLVVLPVARVRRSGGRFERDGDYVPPSLRISASDRLVASLRRVIGQLDAKRGSVLQALDAIRRARGGQSVPRVSVSFGENEVAMFWLLHAINSALARLRHVHSVRRSEHPERLYTELAQLAGGLSTFSIDADPNALPADALPAYDHDALGARVTELERRIAEHLELVVPTTCVYVELRRRRQSIYQGAVDDPRVFGPSQWILRVKSSLPAREVAESLPLMAKVDADDAVDDIMRVAVSGLSLTHLPSPPSATSPRSDSVYFSLSTVGDGWSAIQQRRRVGVYLPPELAVTEVELAIVVDA